jgi:hypothetical protein
MRLLKGVVLGFAACLAASAAAQDADPLERPAEPLSYARICDASGAAFFVVPGAASCRAPGGQGLAGRHRFGPRTIAGGATGCGDDIAREARGFVTGPSRATSQIDGSGVRSEVFPRSGFTGSVGLTFGVTRSFLQADPIWISADTYAARDDERRTSAGSRAYGTTFVDKAFIRFAGLTAGQARTFQADAQDCAKRGGFDVTIGSFAYTATFGDGFPTWIALEDRSSRRPAALGTIASWPESAPISINGISAPSFRTGSGGGEVPDIVGDFRGAGPFGTVQVDAAALQAYAGLFTNQALAAPSPAYPIPPLPSNSYGLAGQAGDQPNMDYLSPGDRLWLQAAYENGVYGTAAGTSTGATSGAADGDRAAERGLRMDRQLHLRASSGQGKRRGRVQALFVADLQLGGLWSLPGRSVLSRCHSRVRRRHGNAETRGDRGRPELRRDARRRLRYRRGVHVYRREAGSSRRCAG